VDAVQTHRVGDDTSDMVDAALAGQAARLAETLARRAAELETRAERRRRRSMASLLADRDAVEMTVRLLDRALRPWDPERVAQLVSRQARGAPRSLGVTRRFLLDGFSRWWPVAPQTAVRLMKAGLRHETRSLILRGERRPLRRALSSEHRLGLEVNLNPIGEAVLSESEARRRLSMLEGALSDPLVDAVSVKISSVRAQIHPLAHEAVVDDICDVLRRLYDRAGPKLVALDMEEYRDLAPTLEAYSRVAREPGRDKRTHAIALQAYLPDSFAALQDLTELGNKRVEAGGVPLRVRIVKGANLGAERIESALHGWPQAPYTSKAEVDANAKRMLEWALDPSRAAGMDVGLGSHNVFDIAAALTIAAGAGTSDVLTIEMLRGMADPLMRAVAEIHPRVLVYSPTARDDDFLAAIAYLVRRLDEQSTPGNFLHDTFGLRVGDAAWTRQLSAFNASWTAAASVSTEPRRALPADAPVAAADGSAPFSNVADTDWAVASNRRELHAALDGCPPDATAAAAVSAEDVERAVAVAAADPDGWAQRPLSERRAVLLAAASELQRRRLALVALMAHETSKTPAEGDPEVSEAVDYAAYYARSLDAAEADDRVTLQPRGVVAVLPPWNFPLAIPLGGVCAGLIGGNRVVLKPSPLAARTALAGCEALWAAGVPASALQLVVTDTEGAALLAAHPDVDTVVFTGSTATAETILQSRPGRRFVAEAGGKNAMVVSATADRDLAIKDVLRSAFGHAGQKCSAASLVVCESEVFDDPSFRRRLAAAAATLRCGAATDPATDVAPLLTDPNRALRAVLDHPAHGEWWALRPRRLGERLWSPGVLWDVQPGSDAHMSELFGPVVGVMRARDLDDAVSLVNETGYGLTSGLESLDEDEWAQWADGVAAGNLYVNRPTTGAVVGRQPFGGWGRSGFGPGAKAGGPHYALQLCRVEAAGGGDPSRRYDETWAGRVEELSGLPGQANLFRYRPASRVVIRAEPTDDPAAVALRRRAAEAAGCDAELSTPDAEPLDRLCRRLGDVDRIVRCGPDAPRTLHAAAARTWTWVCCEPATGTELDMLPFVWEQSISVDYHRYGWVPPDPRLPWPQTA